MVGKTCVVLRHKTHVALCCVEKQDISCVEKQDMRCDETQNVCCVEKQDTCCVEKQDTPGHQALSPEAPRDEIAPCG